MRDFEIEVFILNQIYMPLKTYLLMHICTYTVDSNCTSDVFVVIVLIGNEEHMPYYKM